MWIFGIELFQRDCSLEVQMRECPAVRITYVRWECRGLEINTIQSVDIHERRKRDICETYSTFFRVTHEVDNVGILFCLNLKTNQIQRVTVSTWFAVKRKYQHCLLHVLRKKHDCNRLHELTWKCQGDCFLVLDKTLTTYSK